MWAHLCAVLASSSLPAMDDHGPSLGWVIAEDSLTEGEESSGVHRHTVIRPHQEVELTYLTDWHLGTALTSKLWEGGGGGGRI